MAMLEYLKIIKNKSVDIFPTPSIAKNINNVNYEGYEDGKLKKLMYEGPCCTEAILYTFKLKRVEKMKTEEPFIPL